MVLKKKLCIFSVLICIAANLSAAVKVPAFREYVNDYANVINPQDEQEIIRYCSDLEDTTGIQLAVLTMPSLGGEDITSFAIRTCEEWGIGQKGSDNGALLLLAMEERDLRIEVGYGLEGKLTDAKCGLILRNVVIPELREGNYSRGLLKGIQNMGGVASDNAELVSKSVANGSSASGDDSIFGFLFLIIWLIFFFSVITSKNGLFKWLVLSRMFGNSGRHRYNPPRRPTPGPRSSFNPGSFGGSSFRGGGGGHFGGGGATGHF